MRGVVKFQENLIRCRRRHYRTGFQFVLVSAESDLSLGDLQFYESGGVESVNEICTGHLKTSGERTRVGVSVISAHRNGTHDKLFPGLSRLI